MRKIRLVVNRALNSSAKRMAVFSGVLMENAGKLDTFPACAANVFAAAERWL